METLLTLYKELFGCEPSRTEAITGSGSNRSYYRFYDKAGKSVIACRGTSVHENHAFISLARHFADKHLPVPAVLAADEAEEHYLQEDLGARSLFDALRSGRESGGHYSEEETGLIKKAMRILPHVQVEGAEGLDFSVCHPVASLDRTGILFDLNYFKYCFLKTTSVEFDEYRLEKDFQDFATDLLSQSCSIVSSPTFMYRDFQARNIMIRDGKPWFIDFQGGRRGPVQYDLASFLFNAGTRFPEPLRHELENVYLDALSEFEKLSRD